MKMTPSELSLCPVIAAVKNEEQLDRAILSDCETIFLLFGDILNISSLVARAKAAGKRVIVHIDLVGGLASREIAVDFIAKTTASDGIISTKPSLIKRARELSLFTVLRVFVIDSMALANMAREREMVEPDVFEILPGVMPDVIERICKAMPTPIIAGGLISEKREILSALSAGAIAVSTTNEDAWSL